MIIAIIKLNIILSRLGVTSFHNLKRTRLIIRKSCSLLNIILLLFLFSPLSGFGQIAEKTDTIQNIEKKDTVVNDKIDTIYNTKKSINPTGEKTGVQQKEKPPTLDVKKITPNKNIEETKKSDNVTTDKQTIKKEKKPAKLTTKLKKQGSTLKVVIPKQKRIKRVIENDGLLDIIDGSYKYSRIPDINIKEVLPDENPDVSSINIDDTPFNNIDENSSLNKKGFLGLRKGTITLVIRIVLFLIIIAIYILYRQKSKENKGKVLKRFPKS